MLKHRRENILRNCLICWRCGAWCGPAHYELRDGSVYCGICGDRNPLGNIWKMSMQDLTEPRLIWIPWTRSGTAAHAISPDGRTPLGLDYVLLCRDIRAGSSLYRDERSAACETSQRHGAGRKRLHCGQRYTGEPQEPLQDRLEQAVRKAPVYDLSTKCTACGYAIPPKEHQHTGSDTTRCPKCGADFVPVPKGKWSQLGG